MWIVPKIPLMGGGDCLARIRTIKPEFFSSPDTAKASPRARLLYIAMWCWADDYGVGESNMNGLLGFAFPDSDDLTRKELQRLCKEVQSAYKVDFYEVRGRFYYSVPSWDLHQKTERRSKKLNPRSDDPDAVPDQRFYETEEMLGSSVVEPRKNTRGNIGTGEQGNIGTAPERFDEFWQAYPRRDDKAAARKSYAAALKKTDAGSLIAGATAYALEKKSSEKKFIKLAATWLNNECWLNEYVPAVASPGGVLWEGE
jgi:hypothetical protein